MTPETEKRRPGQDAAPPLEEITTTVTPPAGTMPEARVVETWTGQDGSPRVTIACPYCTTSTGWGRSRRTLPARHVHGVPADGGSLIRVAHCADAHERGYPSYRIVNEGAA